MKSKLAALIIGSAAMPVLLPSCANGPLTNATLNRGTYAFFFNQRGLMAGLGLQGSRITRIHPGA
jgi:hypothetical protein